jgi:hypothetical protein
MQLTSEDNLGSMGLVGAAKIRSLESDVLDLEKELETEYPSSLLEPSKLQNVGRHFETSFPASFKHKWALIPPTQLTEHKWSLSRLYSEQRIASAEAVAERVLNSLQSIPAGQRIQVYVSLLGKLEERVREQRKQTPREKLFAKQFVPRRIDERDKEDDEDRNHTGIEASEDTEEKPFYETASAELWSKMFQEWASSHRQHSYEADDSRESIYEGRG